MNIVVFFNDPLLAVVFQIPSTNEKLFVVITTMFDYASVFRPTVLLVAYPDYWIPIIICKWPKSNF